LFGQDIAVRADDDARAQALLPLLPRHAELPAAVALIAEELAEHGRDSVVPSRKAGPHHTGRSNGHDRGQYFFTTGAKLMRLAGSSAPANLNVAAD